jgi:hypothetical protein
MEPIAVLSGCCSRKDTSKSLIAAQRRYKGLGHSYIQQGVKTSSVYTKTRWAIISAKYGLISPEQPIPNYNETFQDKTPLEIRDSGGKLKIPHFVDRFLNEGPQYINIVTLGRSYYISAQFSGHIRYQIPTVCVYQGEDVRFLNTEAPNCIPFKVSITWVSALKCNRISLNSRVGQLLTFIAAITQKPDTIATASGDSSESRLLLLQKGLRWYERHISQHGSPESPKHSRG